MNGIAKEKNEYMMRIMERLMRQLTLVRYEEETVNDELAKLIDQECGGSGGKAVVCALCEGVDLFYSELDKPQEGLYERLTRKLQVEGCSEEVIRERMVKVYMDQTLLLSQLCGNEELPQEQYAANEEMKALRDKNLSCATLSDEELKAQVNVVSERVGVMFGVRAGEVMEEYTKDHMILYAQNGKKTVFEHEAKTQSMCFAAARYICDESVREEPKALGFVSAAQTEMVAAHLSCEAGLISAEQEAERLSDIGGVLAGAAAGYGALAEAGLGMGSVLGSCFAELAAGVGFAAGLEALLAIGGVLAGVGVIMWMAGGIASRILEKTPAVQNVAEWNVQRERSALRDQVKQKSRSVLAGAKETIKKHVVNPFKAAAGRVKNWLCGAAKEAEKEDKKEAEKTLDDCPDPA